MHKYVQTPYLLNVRKLNLNIYDIYFRESKIIRTMVPCVIRKKAVPLQKFFKYRNMKSKEQLKRDSGKVLRSLRYKKSEEAEVKLTQADIAYSSGISVRYYNELENGKKLPTIDSLMKIAESYKMSLSDICKQIEEY